MEEGNYEGKEKGRNGGIEEKGKVKQGRKLVREKARDGGRE